MPRPKVEASFALPRTRSGLLVLGDSFAFSEPSPTTSRPGPWSLGTVHSGAGARVARRARQPLVGTRKKPSPGPGGAADDGRSRGSIRVWRVGSWYPPGPRPPAGPGGSGNQPHAGNRWSDQAGSDRGGG